jgi:phosphatidylglycerophosphatase C
MGPTDDATRPVVAAFDVDGTLTVRDCVVPFMRRATGTPRIALRLASRPGAIVPAVLRRDRDALKAAASHAAFAGVPVERLHGLADTFGAEIVDGWLRADTLERLRWHVAEGHAVVLVSASFELYLDVVGARLGVDHVLGTRLELGADGRCTGRLVGPNCRGLEKVARLHRWLDDRYGGRDAVVLWAYGDSAGDRHLLADADHPVWAAEPLTSVAASHD